MYKKILDFLNEAIVYITIGSFILSISIWFKLKRQQRIIKKSLKNLPTQMPEGFNERCKWASDINTENPIAVCMSLVPVSRASTIKKDVEKFLQIKGGRFSKMEVIEFNSDGINSSNLGEIIQGMRNIRQQLDAMSATEVHLFIQGPVMAGVIAGAVFDNWKLVKLYSPNLDTKQYEYWSLLEK